MCFEKKKRNMKKKGKPFSCQIPDKKEIYDFFRVSVLGISWKINERNNNTQP